MISVKLLLAHILNLNMSQSKHQKGVFYEKFIPELITKGYFSFVYSGNKFSHFYLKVSARGSSEFNIGMGQKLLN